MYLFSLQVGAEMNLAQRKFLGWDIKKIMVQRIFYQEIVMFKTNVGSKKIWFN